MVRISRRGVLAGIGGVGALSLTGRIGAQEGREVMLGIVQPESGDLGELGTPIADGAELPGRELADAGSEFTVDVQREDTQTLSEAGISAAQSLVDAGYPMFTGAAASDVTIPVAQEVATPNQVVMCSPASTSPDITDLADDDFVFRTAPSDALQGDVIAEVAFEERGWEQGASLHLNDAYGVALSGVFEDRFEELGGEITGTEAFEPEQPSYTSVLESVLADDPDFLLVIAFPVSGIQIFRDFYAGFDPDLPVIVTDGLIEDDLPESVDNPMDNVLGTAPAADGPEVDAFAESYEDEYGRSPGVFNAHGYDASAVMILANVRAGDNDGVAVRDEMRAVANPNGETVGPSNFPEAVELAAAGEEITYEGASSVVEFDDNGDMRAVTYDIFEFGDFELEVVDQIDFEE
ncbi:ABC transporter substrate-binding protein [Natronobacterium texcoconense]|uniref:ABC-type branched-chain amino acid transport system, substrate-binding protein n=1 Tax=Natronobacterium texcoconense TaxID=1095778 RepID=A0A1H1A2R1_NATTX|nr:ABC transporter substrate-binding protein [Natronobacterium texcoconense]SDQ33576.1 ABC-type branched-chain amino acid transport system, substrate-binding protein [Natronobacterium texcoconense]